MAAKKEDDDEVCSKRPDERQSRVNPSPSTGAENDQHEDKLLETKIGRVVGGIEAAKRFNALLAKTLKLTE